MPRVLNLRGCGGVLPEGAAYIGRPLYLGGWAPAWRQMGEPLQSRP
jgi:hypothetical protein